MSKHLLIRGSVTGCTFLSALIEGIVKDYVIHYEVDHLESVKLFWNVKSGPDHACPREVDAEIRLFDLNTHGKHKAIPTADDCASLEEGEKKKDPRLIISIFVITNSDQKVEAKAIFVDSKSLRSATHVGLYIYAEPGGSLAPVIASACQHILAKPPPCAIKNMTISTLDYKHGRWRHNKKLPPFLEPALRFDGRDLRSENAPCILLTGYVRGMTGLPDVIEKLSSVCNLRVKSENTDLLRTFCPKIEFSSAELDSLKNSHRIAGVIHICNLRDGDVCSRIKDTTEEYSSTFPYNVVGVFIYICVIWTLDRQSKLDAIDAIDAQIAAMRLQQTLRGSSEPLRYTMICVRSFYDAHLSDVISSACLHIMTAPPHINITRMSLSTFKDKPSEVTYG